MWAEIKHTHRVPVTGCPDIDSLFTLYCLPKFSRPVMAEALILAHETVCDRTD